MGLITQSDPGAVAHGAEALRAMQSMDQQYAETELTRARTDAVKLQAQADLDRVALADRVARERAARNMGIAVEELAKLGVDPADLNMADDVDFLREHAPGLVEQAAAAFPDPSQKLEAGVFLAKSRMAVESAQSQKKKQGLYQQFALRNQDLMVESQGGSGGAGATKAENPLVAQLRAAADDPKVDDVSFAAQMQGVEDQLEQQTAAQIEYELNLAKAQELYAQGAGGLKNSQDRKRAAQIMAKIKHSSLADAEELMLELSVIMGGHGDAFRAAMDRNAQQAAAAVIAMQAMEQGQAGAGGQAPAASASRGAGATGIRAPEAKSGGGTLITPAKTPEEGNKRLLETIESSKNDRGSVHWDTVLKVAAQLFPDEEWTEDTLREKVRSLYRTKQEPTRQSQPSAYDLEREARESQGLGGTSTWDNYPAVQGAPKREPRKVPYSEVPQEDTQRARRKVPYSTDIVARLARAFEESGPDKSAADVVRNFEATTGEKPTKEDIERARAKARGGAQE